MINKDDFQQMALKNRFLLEQFTDFKEFFFVMDRFAKKEW